MYTILRTVSYNFTYLLWLITFVTSTFELIKLVLRLQCSHLEMFDQQPFFPGICKSKKKQTFIVSNVSDVAVTLLFLRFGSGRSVVWLRSRGQSGPIFARLRFVPSDSRLLIGRSLVTDPSAGLPCPSFKTRSTASSSSLFKFVPVYVLLSKGISGYDGRNRDAYMWVHNSYHCMHCGYPSCKTLSFIFFCQHNQLQEVTNSCNGPFRHIYKWIVSR